MVVVGRNDNFIPVASGDNDYLETYNSGVWFMPIYSQANQRKTTKDLGYKVKSGGGIIGVDTKFNSDQTMIGAALSVINSDMKYKTSYKDKTKANSLIFSLYGKQNINEGLFVQGLASYAVTKVHHKEERIFSTGNQFAKSKYTSRSYGGEILFGYDAKLCKEATLTPFAGISYIKFKDGGYREKGLLFANRTVAASRSDRTDEIIGARDYLPLLILIMKRK
ncbi:MAG: autotransporter outer membrane beta-barrel domain-containing protein [Candidatus Rickettsia vulgarisii]